MKTNTTAIERLRAIAREAKTGSRTAVIPGLPEFNQITPSPIVAAHFASNPQQRAYYVDTVAHKFRSAVNALDHGRTVLDKELLPLRIEHQTEADYGNHDKARELHAQIDSQLKAFDERYAKDLNLAKGGALVLANKTLEKIEATLVAGERNDAAQAEALLKDDAYVQRELLATNRAILAELQKQRS